MKTFIIVEHVPAIVEYKYTIEAEDEETAMEMVQDGIADPDEYNVDPIYESSVRLDFTRTIIENQK